MKKKFLLMAILLIASAFSLSLYAQTDVTNLVGTSQTAWNGAGIYSSSVERYYGSLPCGSETPLYQDIENLESGVYMATLKATSNCTGDRDNLGENRYALEDGDETVAYVYAKSGETTDKSFFPAHRSTGVSIYYERSVVVEVSNGSLQLGLGLADLNKSNWHTIQIVSLVKYESFDQLVEPLKAPLKAKLDEVNSYYTNSEDNPAQTAKATFKTAIDAAQQLYDSKTTYQDVVAAAADFEQAIKDLEAAYEVYALSGAIPAEGYPFDITFKITNPTFGNNNATGWSGSAPGFQTFGNAEFYMKNFDIYQTITGMPQAKYLLKVKAFQRPGAAADVISAYTAAEDNEDGTFGVNAEIYVNNASQKIKNAASAERTTALAKGGNEANSGGYYIPDDMNSADKYFSAGYYENEAEILCTTGSVKFGFRCSEGTGDRYWTIFDDFRLYLTEAIDLSVYENELAIAVEKATEQAERNVPQAVSNAIKAVIDEYNKEWTTPDEYATAIEAVNNSYAAYDMDALETAYLAAENYTFTSKYFDAVSALAEVEYKENTEGAHDALETAIENNAFVTIDKTELNSYTKAEDINTYISSLNEQNDSKDQALRTAGIEYANNAEPTGDNKFDLTFMLTNANLEGLPTWAPCDGWYTDQQVIAGENNSQVMNSDDVASNDGKNAFYEYWSRTPVANNEFTLYQEVTLPNGIYNMSCLAFAQISGNRSADFQPEQEICAVKFFANDTEGSTIQSNTLAEANIEFVQESTGKVKIGLKACEGNTYNWMGIGYVELYKLPSVKSCVLSDADEEAPAAGAYTSITYDRNLLTGLNTIVLPFQTTKEELGAETILEYTGTTTNSDNIVLNFKEVETLSPNVPYAILMTAEAALPVFENKTLIAPTDLTVTDANGNYNFVGTYTCWTKDVDSPIVNGDYVAGAEEFKKAKGGNGLKAYRAYLKNTSGESTNIAFNFNGDIIDGIEAVEIFNRMSGDIYNINGQKVSHTQKGVYIINGKKVVVK